MINNIIPWAIVTGVSNGLPNSAEFASYNTTFGLGSIGQTGFAGYDFNGAMTASTTGLLPTQNIKASGALPTINSAGMFTSELIVNSLTMSGNMAFNGNGVLNLTAGAIVDDLGTASLGSGIGDGIQVSGREENWSTVATPGQLAFNRHVHETSETAES